MSSQQRGKGSGRLPHGPHGLTPEQVEADQRTRLIAAMVWLASDTGYIATTVGDLIKHAGVSRKTFYALFDDRKDLLLEAFDVVSATLYEQSTKAAHLKGGATRQLEALMRRLCRVGGESPGSIALSTIEIAALDPVGLERREKLMSDCGRLLEQCLHGSRDDGTGDDRLPVSLIRALIGSTYRTIYAHVRMTNEGLSKLAPELARWTRSYDPLPAGFQFEPSPPPAPWSQDGGLIGGRAPGTLTLAPAGYRAPVPRRTAGFQHHVNRERILDAVAQLVSEIGYAELTAQAIAERADVSERTFLAHFKDKDDAFAAALEVGHMKAMALVARVRERARNWGTGVRDAVHALVEFLASEPCFTRLAFVDAPLAGPTMAKRTHEHMAGYARLLLDDAPQRRRPPQVAPEAALHGLFELAFHYAVRHRASDLTRTGGEAVYLVLAPFLGVSEAAELAAA